MRRQQQPIPKAQSARIERILLVGRDAAAAALLADAGHVVVEARDGTQALADFEHYRPALVLLADRWREVGSELRALRGGRATPMVVLGDPEDPGEADDVVRERRDLLPRVNSLMRLVAQRDALDELQWQRQQLAAHVVHDLRVPLTNVSANLQYVLRDRNLSEHAAGAARDALDAVDVAARMTADLLDLAMAEQGALVPRLQTIDLAQLLEDVRRQALRRMEGEIQQQIAISTRLERAHITADRILLRRVVENLLDNAIKYAPSGDTIHLEARTFPPEWIELRVRDRGPGIPAMHRNTVFQHYAQLEREEEEKLRGGRGLGLAFCKVAIDAHHGRIWVEDNEPRGACFCVRLPQVRDGSVHM